MKLKWDQMRQGCLSHISYIANNFPNLNIMLLGQFSLKTTSLLVRSLYSCTWETKWTLFLAHSNFMMSSKLSNNDTMAILFLPFIFQSSGIISPHIIIHLEQFFVDLAIQPCEVVQGCGLQSVCSAVQLRLMHTRQASCQANHMLDRIWSLLRRY